MNESYHTIPEYTIPNNNIPYRSIIYHTYHSISYHTIPHYAVSYPTILYFTILLLENDMHIYTYSWHLHKPLERSTKIYTRSTVSSGQTPSAVASC